VNLLSLAMLTGLATLSTVRRLTGSGRPDGRAGVFSRASTAGPAAGGTEAAELLRAGFDLAARLLAFPARFLSPARATP